MSTLNLAIFFRIQSGFRSSQHVKVPQDLLRAPETGRVSVLDLLDFSAAFDKVHHSILLKTLVQVVFIRHLIRYQFAHVHEVSFSYGRVSRGDPQGSGHGTIFFTLCMLPLGKIIQEQK